eukprot:scaffold18403_cov99-Isochrysis_galbana.AAC.2
MPPLRRRCEQTAQGPAVGYLKHPPPPPAHPHPSPPRQPCPVRYQAVVAPPAPPPVPPTAHPPLPSDTPGVWARRTGGRRDQPKPWRPVSLAAPAPRLTMRAGSQDGWPCAPAAACRWRTERARPPAPLAPHAAPCARPRPRTAGPEIARPAAFRRRVVVTERGGPWPRVRCRRGTACSLPRALRDAAPGARRRRRGVPFERGSPPIRPGCTRPAGAWGWRPRRRWSGTWPAQPQGSGRRQPRSAKGTTEPGLGRPPPRQAAPQGPAAAERVDELRLLEVDPNAQLAQLHLARRLHRPVAIARRHQPVWERLDRREETAGLARVGAAGGSGEQPRGGELLGSQQLAPHLGRVQLAAHALGGRGRQTGRRGGGGFSQRRQVLKKVQEPLEDEGTVGGRDEKGQGGGEVGRVLRNRQVRQGTQQQLEQRLLLCGRPLGDAGQQRRHERRPVGGRRAGEPHLQVDEREVGDEAVGRGRAELARERAQRQPHRWVAADALVQVRQDGHHLGAHRGVAICQEAEDVGERRVQQRRQLAVVAQSEPQLRLLELGQQRLRCHVWTVSGGDAYF